MSTHWHQITIPMLLPILQVLLMNVFRRLLAMMMVMFRVDAAGGDHEVFVLQCAVLRIFRQLNLPDLDGFQPVERCWQVLLTEATAYALYDCGNGAKLALLTFPQLFDSN